MAEMGEGWYLPWLCMGYVEYSVVKGCGRYKINWF